MSFHGAATGITLSRVDFSDPQGEKVHAAAKQPRSKHARRFVNEGHDVQTVEDLQTAMLSAGGITGIRVALVDSLGIKNNPIKRDGISLINNLQYTNTTITVWRSYNIGSGKTVDKQLPTGIHM